MQATSTDLRQLLDSIYARHLKPEDEFEMAALLESIGWNDARIREQIGYRDVFELAAHLWRMRDQTVDFQGNDYVAPLPWFITLRDYVRQFFRGMIFALPMGLSLISMLYLHFSLWSYQYLTVRVATSIAMGTILSFLSVGGFMQAIARRGFFFIFQGYFRMAQRVTFRFIRAGVLLSLGLSASLYGLNTLFPVIPYSMLTITIGYYLVLNAIWLAVTVLYILKKEIFFTGLILIGILFVYVGFVGFHLNILVAQTVAMLVVSMLSLGLVVYLFKRATSDAETGISPPMSRPGVTLYSVLPYFNYGVLYFCLLFIDRVMAWSTNSMFMPYVIWFRGDYEVGLDFALLTLIIPMGFSEVIVTKIMTEAALSQKQYLASHTLELNRSYVAKYRRGIMWMVVISIVSAISVYFGVKWAMDQYVVSILHEVVLTGVSNYVFIVGLISYTVLSMALLNAVIMFSLSRPELVVQPILLAVAINFVSGFVLTRWISYSDAVWGLLLGSVVFMFLTTRNVLRALSQVDYHLYLLS